MKKNDFYFDNWELDVLGIHNWRSNYSAFKSYFEYIRKNHKKIEGDILEFGVFNGASLLATAIILKKLKSKKKVYGYDSFKGLIKFKKEDDFKNFNIQYKKNKISKKNLIDHKKLFNFKKLILNKKIDPKNISGSNNFTKVDLSLLKKKIKLLKLDNIVIVKGDFKQTLKKEKIKFKKLMAINVDCDLYDSYETIFNRIEPYLSKKSYIHLDEYYSLKFPGPRDLINNFLIKNKSFKLKVFIQQYCFPRFYLIKVK